MFRMPNLSGLFPSTVSRSSFLFFNNIDTCFFPLLQQKERLNKAKSKQAICRGHLPKKCAGQITIVAGTIFLGLLIPHFVTNIWIFVCFKVCGHIVDGRNPAPLYRWFIYIYIYCIYICIYIHITGFQHVSTILLVVQDFAVPSTAAKSSPASPWH